MKPKKFEKSLTLKKQTIVDLNEMKNVKSGNADVPDSSWDVSKIVCCATGCNQNSACVCW